MALHTKQITWMQQLRRVAFIDDGTYRALIASVHPGATSSTDIALTNEDFDAIMHGLEKHICAAIAAGLITPEEVLAKVADPWRFHRQKIDAEGRGRVSDYSSRKKSKETEPATARQIGMIRGIQAEFAHFEPQVKDWAYLRGMLEKIPKSNPPPGGFTGFDTLSTWSAKLLIDALKDRRDAARIRAERAATAAEMRDIPPDLSIAEVDYPPEDPDEILPF